MDVAIVGAFGTVGRQLAFQLLDAGRLDRTDRLQLVANHGGASEHEMFGMRSDLADAFVDDAPRIEVTADPEEVDAELVVMLAGATVPRDVNVRADRAALAAENLAIFGTYAHALAERARPATVIVQSNPVELGVKVFADALGRHRVLGAGSWNDSLRFRRELARELGVRRPEVFAAMLGEHGSHLVPVWSQISVRGMEREQLEAAIRIIREGRPLSSLADEIDRRKAEVLELVGAGQIEVAYELLEGLPADVRCAVKPFFIHFTSGRTTEASTAHAVVDIVGSLLEGERRVVSAQVALEGEWEDVHGILGVQVLLDENGWRGLVEMDLADDETEALHASAASIAAMLAECMAPPTG